MKLTCLSKGRGFHFPPCHMLNFCGFRILFDCPLDLSSLMAFSPIPTSLDALSFEESKNNEKRQKIEDLLDAKNLVFVEPWYKTVNKLHLWNASLIDVILISSPMGIMGLPYLTRQKGFSAKIYVTEASARIGQLMMEDLVSMHAEFRQFYGPEESNFPRWLRQEELEILPSVLKEILVGKDGVELGGWMPLYSAADVKDCIQKINTLNYAQEACYNGTLVIKAFSSGVEIGSCNWTLNGPKGDIAYLSSSCFFSAHAMAFDYSSLQRTCTLIYSDFSSLIDAQDVEDGDNYTDPTSDKLLPPSFEDSDGFSLDSDVNLDEKEKLIFICSCAIECVKDGGSVLIPINRLGTILQLLEEMATLLEASAMEVPIYIISSVAEELLALLNIIPEWLSKQRQERLFAGEPLFDHVKLLKEKKIRVVPNIHSHQLLKDWQEPCIVFCPHWSLRMGPVVHLLRRWCGDPKSLLILEDMVNPELALLPFKPVEMKVLQCLFPSGIGLQKVQPLLKTLQPKTILFPEDLRLKMCFSCEKSFSVSYYTEAETLKVPCQKESSELKIEADLADLASQFYWKTFKKEGINVTKLKGKLLMENGRHHLLLDNDKKTSLRNSSLVRCGLTDYHKLIPELSKMGINASMELIKDDVDHKSNTSLPARVYRGFHALSLSSTMAKPGRARRSPPSGSVSGSSSLSSSSRSSSRSRSRSRSFSSSSRSPSRSSKSRSRSPPPPRRKSSAEPARRGRSPPLPPPPQSKRPSPPPRKPSPVRESLVLHVEKLSRNVNEGHLKEIFSNFGEVVSVELVMDRAVNLPKGYGYVHFKTRGEAEKALLYMDGAQIDGNVVKARFTLPPRQKASPPPKAVAPKRDAPRTDNAGAEVEKDGPKRPRESSPRRKPPPSPRRRSPVPRRAGSPRRPESPRRRADSPVRRRLDSPYRRGAGDTPPRRRPVSPGRGRSPSPPPRRLRSPARVSPRRMRGSPGPGRRRSPPPPPRRRSPPRRARSPPRRSPVGRRRSRSPIRRSARSRSRSFSPRRGRPPMRRGRSSSYSDSPSPRKVSRRSKSRSPRRPLKGRASSNSSSSSSPPPARKP